MEPEAPARLSITIGWPSAAAIGSASTRARLSVAVPGAKGTMARIGRSGQAAHAARGSPAMASTPAVSPRRVAMIPCDIDVSSPPAAWRTLLAGMEAITVPRRNGRRDYRRFS